MRIENWELTIGYPHGNNCPLLIVNCQFSIVHYPRFLQHLPDVRLPAGTLAAQQVGHAGKGGAGNALVVGGQNQGIGPDALRQGEFRLTGRSRLNRPFLIPISCSARRRGMSKYTMRSIRACVMRRPMFADVCFMDIYLSF